MFDSSNFELICGFKIVVVPACQVQVARTWKERLFSLPWNPLQKTKTVTREVIPDGEFLHNHNVFFGNATTVQKLKEAV